MKRILGITFLLLVVPFGLFGCGDDKPDKPGKADSGDNQVVEDVDQEAAAAVDGVVHDISAALGTVFRSGSRHFAICGDTYAPRGVILRGSLNFDPGETTSELTEEEAVEAAATALEADGWKVTRPANPAIVEGEKGRITVRVEIGAALVAVKLSTECVETSGEVAKEAQDRDPDDIVWKE